MLRPSIKDVAIVQSRLFGDNKGSMFNDLEKVVGYPENITINVDKPLLEMVIMHGEVIDGIRLTYLKDDGETTNMTHGSSEACTDRGLMKTKIMLKKGCENILAISGKYGSTKHYGKRITQLCFVICDFSTGMIRIAGPFGKGETGETFHCTANGSFVACGGFAIDTDLSLRQLRQAGKAGGLYGMTFAEVDYRSV